MSEAPGRSKELGNEEAKKSNLRLLINHFERNIRKNEELRLKYPNDPLKFLSSEVDLDENIESLREVAASPSLLQEFLDNNGMKLLVILLQHPNIDLGGEVAGLLVEIVDVNNMTELEKPEEFLKILLDSGCPSLLTELLTLTNEQESEDKLGILTKCLQLVDNLLEIDPVLFSEIFTTKCLKFVPWLLSQIRASHTEQAALYNRVFAAEVLSIILQYSSKCRKNLGLRKGLDGVEKLLRCVAMYRKADPVNAEEEEYVENIGNCLVSLLQESENREVFANVLGLELMIRLMRERLKIYPIALKLTSYALESEKNCQLFVEKLGLKSLFGIFMKKGTRWKRGSRADREEDENCCVSILNLLKFGKGITIARVLNKFSEKNFEKLERLIELHERHYSKLKTISRKSNLQTNTGFDEVSELVKTYDLEETDREYLDRCDAGLFTLQIVDSIFVRLSNAGNTQIRNKINAILRVRGVAKSEMGEVMEEYIGRMDSEANERKLLETTLLENFMNN